MNKEEVLEMLGRSGALLEGHFELRSGLHSAQYFQCANALRFPDMAEKMCAALVRKIRDGIGSDQKIDSVISPALGGIIVGHEVARALGVKSIFAEKKNDKLELRRFKIEKGENIVVAEDVVTKGGRVKETVDIVLKNGGNVVCVGVLVDRSGGLKMPDCRMFSLLEMQPVTYDPGDCPLCREGVPLVHPGS